MKLYGKTDSLKSEHKKRLLKLYQRKVSGPVVLPKELAREITILSLETSRIIALFISRRGKIEAVTVGDANRVYLPDIGRFRGASGRLRGISLIQTSLQKEAPIPRDSLGDLIKLRFDCLLIIGCDKSKSGPGGVSWAHLAGGPKSPFRESYADFYEATVPDFGLFDAIENELNLLSERKKVSAGEKVILVHCFPSKETRKRHHQVESEALCKTAGYQILESVTQNRKTLDQKTLIGKGKIEELAQIALEANPDYIIFGQDLSPTQVRNIENTVQTPILDRTQLILDIFDRHAKSSDAKIQVELARLRYQLPRLATKSTMLSRITGGIGGRGPGETKAEIYRRRCLDRISSLEKKLKQHEKTRANNRKRRMNQAGTRLISIVGYTNAGKSTLLRNLTGSLEVSGENKLFATLEPKTRNYRYNNKENWLFSDTVGFIENMPPDLKKAFASTFSEIENADLILHVIDGSDLQMEYKRKVVNEFLEEMNFPQIPILEIFNKLDSSIRRPLGRETWISAENKDGFNQLLKTIRHAPAKSSETEQKAPRR